MANRNTIWFGVANGITASTAETTVELQDNIYIYPVSITNDTEIIFDPSDLTAPGVDAEKWGTQFYLLLTMGATVYSVTFPAGISWNCGIAPTINAANKKYPVRYDRGKCNNRQL